ncbi:MAG: diguanylate cyclase (GGDEF)-like protein/PAS domain S-box-containing protein [Bradymonadia bacterium]|jgi:diguanylate cyclase (GGDEF)-like protein/PAS domain S-box-containing protein
MTQFGGSVAEKYWSSLCQHCNDYVVVLDANDTYIFINRVAPGLAMEELIGKKSPFDFIPQDQHAVVRAKLAAARTDKVAQSYVVNVPILEYSVRTDIFPVINEAGNVDQLIQVSHDLKELHRAESVLLRQNTELESHRNHLDRLVLDRTAELREANELLFEHARRDSLTGLFNRREIFRVLEAEIQRIERYGGRLSVLLVDLDFFKAVNDDHGHLAGDAVLADVSATLQAGVRETDTLGRYGGEEFLVVLPETADYAAEQLGERLRIRVTETSPTFEGQPIPVTCSVGVASACSLEQANLLVAKADEALYKAKAAGRDRVVSMRVSASC